MANSTDELNSLNMLYQRGCENGIKWIKKLSTDAVCEYEPNVTGMAALYCPETGIIHYQLVCEQLSENIQQKGEIIRKRFGDKESKIIGKGG